MKWIAGIAVLGALLFTVSVARADSFEEAEIAYKKGDVGVAFRALTELAERGDARAQNQLGIMYAKGQGVVKDDERAAYWYRKSAEQGQSAAQNNLGWVLANGRGVARNEEEAVGWYQKGANQGNPAAQNNLGIMYADGRGVPKSMQTAYYWWILAASQGYEMARNNRNRAEGLLTPKEREDALAASRVWKPEAPPQVALAPNKPAPREAPRAEQAQPRSSNLPSSTGSGFRVAPGVFVTNHHVVADCSRLRVNGGEADKVTARDERNDLAVVEVKGDAGEQAGIRPSRLQLGEGVVVAGFPLQGILSGLSVTSGNVSRLSGLGGDTQVLQVSAPVQPGNSGGPLMDNTGNVVGVVVSKLDAIRVAKIIGDIPQNVNFAINANALRSFLDANGIGYREMSPGPASSPIEVANVAKRFTVLVECWK